MFSKSEYWILDALATGGVRLDWILSHPSAMEVNYLVEPLTLPATEIEQLVLGLMQRRLVEAAWDWRQHRKYIRLTTVGGEVWEQWAEPDWELYCEDIGVDDFSYADSEQPHIRLVEVSATNGSRLNDATYYLSQCHNNRVIGVSDFERKSPWELWGWKTLPCGLTRKVLLQHCDLGATWPPLESPHWQRTFRRWRRRGFCRSECFTLEKAP